MYRYDEFDQHFVEERVAQFRDQTRRYLDGSLTHTEFGHRFNLEVLARIADTHPVLQEQFGAVLAQSRLDIYQRWARGRIFNGNGPGARAVLRDSRQFGRVPGFWRLWLKSYMAKTVRKLRDRTRPMAHEDQSLR